jgi:hypothetical protein
MKPYGRIVKKNVYLISMDERRRTIQVLEEQRRESLLFRTRTLEDLGKSLAERLGGRAFPGNRGDDYHRFKQEIADSEASIGVIRSALKRIKELDEEISVKRLEKADRKEEAAALYLQLGEYVLAEEMPEFEPPGELRPLKHQRDLLLERDVSLHERLGDLETAPWFSKSMQTLVINSSLKRNRRHLDKLHCQAGEIYARLVNKVPEEAGDDGFSVILRDSRAMRQNLAELDKGIETLEQEKAKIQLSFGFKEKPARHIRILEEKTVRRNEDLRKLYLQVAEGASVLDGLEDGDKAALEKARRYGESAETNGRDIERIEAEIAIDKEKEKIAKLERAVSGQKNRAADSEKNIGELSRKIAEVQKRIDTLKSQEQEPGGQ